MASKKKMKRKIERLKKEKQELCDSLECAIATWEYRTAYYEGALKAVIERAIKESPQFNIPLNHVPPEVIFGEDLLSVNRCFKCNSYIYQDDLIHGECFSCRSEVN